mgnify:CR=1 FL=1
MYCFVHDFVQRACYDLMPHAKKATLHQKIAEMGRRGAVFPSLLSLTGTYDHCLARLPVSCCVLLLIACCPV